MEYTNNIRVYTDNRNIATPYVRSNICIGNTVSVVIYEVVMYWNTCICDGAPSFFRLPSPLTLSVVTSRARDSTVSATATYISVLNLHRNKRYHRHWVHCFDCYNFMTIFFISFYIWSDMISIWSFLHLKKVCSKFESLVCLL